MYKPPNLAGETIVAALRAHYGISADTLTFLPLANEVFFLPDLSEDSRDKALQGFMSLFEPGNIVELAFASEGTAS